ncbi:MAG: HEAT repeat domain-containing protein [Anaerolineae bacterium]|nr:HEAT repeat domain-containing protein [Anaerolineae bacterium]MDQ7036822.1 HEAT repeat domain-containing protein [Anaerolineae bacterium]
MNYEKLIENLNNPKVQSRIASVYILGMVDEVRAIDTLRKRYARESNHQMKQAMQTVGGQLAKAKREGYDTIEAICEHFHINKELQMLASEDEEAKIREIQKNTSRNKKDDNFNDQLWSAASEMLQGGAMAAGIGTPGMNNVVNVDMTSNLGNTTDVINLHNKRIPPVRPRNDDISLWIQRLMTEDDPDTRINIIIQIANMHNIAALPYLANVYWTDEDERVKVSAKKYGTLLYLNAIYWQMAQDGSMQQIIAEKAAKLGVILSEENTIQVQPSHAAHNQSIEDILTAAEAKRKKKKKRL